MNEIPVYVDKSHFGSSFVFKCECGAHYEAHQHYPQRIACQVCSKHYVFVYEALDGTSTDNGQES